MLHHTVRAFPDTHMRNVGLLLEFWPKKRRSGKQDRHTARREGLRDEGLRRSGLSSSAHRVGHQSVRTHSFDDSSQTAFHSGAVANGVDR